MDKRNEENIAKLAFGDLSEADAAEVRAHIAANADAKKALDSYEALCADLRMMRDVPPDQLSKERLRNAILTQGLNPKPVRRTFPWIGALSAGAVAALAIIVVMRTGPATQQQNGTGPVALNFEPSSLGSSDLTPSLNGDDRSLMSGFNSVVNFDEGINAPAPVQPAASQPTQTPSDSVAKDETAVYYPPIRHAARRYVPETNRGESRPAPVDANLSAGVTMSKAIATPKRSSETLVLIKSDKDSDTGASSAVEVHQTEDVIVSS